MFEVSRFPLMSLGRWPDVLSIDASLGRAMEWGDADAGEYSSPLRGELKPDRGCEAGDVGFDGYDGAAGRREGPMRGVVPDTCGPLRGSVIAVLSRLFVARSV